MLLSHVFLTGCSRRTTSGGEKRACGEGSCQHIPFFKSRCSCCPFYLTVIFENLHLQPPSFVLSHMHSSHSSPHSTLLQLAYERSQRELEIQIHHRSLAAIHDELQRKHSDWWDEQLGKEEAKHRKRRSTAVRLERYRAAASNISDLFIFYQYWSGL